MSRSKQRLDDKHEKILRGEAKKPENMECFDCSQKGPFSIVLELGTFVCNDCAGIHRGSPFNHHIKSISTSSFKPEEISSILNKGGNARAAKIWNGKLKASRKPRPGDTRNIAKLMEQKYIKKQFYVSPDIALVPEEDLSDTGILDQIPTPPTSRNHSSNNQNDSDNVFNIAPPPINSFFSSDSTKSQSTNDNFFADNTNTNKIEDPKPTNTGGLLDFSSPEPVSNTQPQTQKPASSLLDLGNDGFTVTPPSQNVQGNNDLFSLNLGGNPMIPSNIATSSQNSMGLDNSLFSQSNMSNQPPSTNNSLFDAMAPVQNTGFNNNSMQPQTGGLGSFENTQNSMGSFGNSQTNPMQYNNMGSFGNNPQQSTVQPQNNNMGSFGNQNSNSMGLFGNTSQQTVTQPQNNSGGFGNQNSMGSFGNTTQQNVVQPQSNNMGSFGNSMQNNMGSYGNSNSFSNSNQQMMGNMQSNINPTQPQNNMGSYGNVQNGMMNQSQSNNYAQNQQNITTPSQPTPSQGCNAEQLNFMQQKFVEKLKTLNGPQQQQMSSQYQQWNMQQRMQFLMKNFGHLLQQQSVSNIPNFESFTPQQTGVQNQMNFNSNQTQNKPPEKGKYANMFSDLDILNKRKY